jgi:hypothetical protein
MIPLMKRMVMTGPFVFPRFLASKTPRENPWGSAGTETARETRPGAGLTPTVCGQGGVR